MDVSTVVDAMNPDLSAFQARGGKLLVLHGRADEVVSPNQTIAYYKAQVAKSVQPAADAFWRLYTVPVFGHGTGAFLPSWDALGALGRWVTSGAAPGVLVGTDTNTATLGRSRALCPYPTCARYGGSGSIDSASNYACVAP